MAWLWWLLAPIASTVCGGALLALRAKREQQTKRRGRDPIGEHQAMLSALDSVATPHPLPMTMQVLEADQPAQAHG